MARRRGAHWVVLAACAALGCAATRGSLPDLNAHPGTQPRIELADLDAREPDLVWLALRRWAEPPDPLGRRVLFRIRASIAGGWSTWGSCGATSDDAVDARVQSQAPRKTPGDAPNAHFDNAEQRALRMTVDYLVGRRAALRGQAERAESRFERVKPTSAYYGHAQFYLGFARRIEGRPAAPALARGLEWLTAATPHDAKWDEHWDRAALALGSVLAIDAVHRGGVGEPLGAESDGLLSACRMFEQVAGSGLTSEAALAAAYAARFRGDSEGAERYLAHAEPRDATARAEVLLVQALLASADPEAAAAARARARGTALSGLAECAELAQRIDAEGGGAALAATLDAGASPDPSQSTLIDDLRADAEIVEHLAYIRFVAAERARLAQASVAFRDALGGDIEAAIDRAERDARAKLAGTARCRVERVRERLEHVLRAAGAARGSQARAKGAAVF